jgi:hypothetical protein
MRCRAFIDEWFVGTHATQSDAVFAKSALTQLGDEVDAICTVPKDSEGKQPGERDSGGKGIDFFATRRAAT